LRGQGPASSLRATFPLCPRAGRPGQENDSKPVIKRCFLAVAAAATLAAGAGPAAAQDVRSAYEFIDHGRGFFPYVAYVVTDRGIIDIGPHSGPALGLGFAIRLTGPFTFDGRVAVFPTERTVFDVQDEDQDPTAIREDPTIGLVDLGTVDLTLLLTDLSLRFDITGPRTWRNLQPYALLGLGAVFGMATDHDAEAALQERDDLRVRFRNGFTGHMGAGTEFFLTQRLTLRLDARNVFYRVHVPEGFRTAARIVPEREWVRSSHLSLGLGLRF
jgi:opacity protein-like surface antigen